MCIEARGSYLVRLCMLSPVRAYLKSSALFSASLQTVAAIVVAKTVEVRALEPPRAKAFGNAPLNVALIFLSELIVMLFRVRLYVTIALSVSGLLSNFDFTAEKGFLRVVSSASKLKVTLCVL